MSSGRAGSPSEAMQIALAWRWLTLTACGVPLFLACGSSSDSQPRGAAGRAGASMSAAGEGGEGGLGQGGGSPTAGRAGSLGAGGAGAAGASGAGGSSAGAASALTSPATTRAAPSTRTITQPATKRCGCARRARFAVTRQAQTWRTSTSFTRTISPKRIAQSMAAAFEGRSRMA